MWLDLLIGLACWVGAGLVIAIAWVILRRIEKRINGEFDG